MFDELKINPQGIAMLLDREMTGMAVFCRRQASLIEFCRDTGMGSYRLRIKQVPVCPQLPQQVASTIFLRHTKVSWPTSCRAKRLLENARIKTIIQTFGAFSSCNRDAR